MDRLEIGQWVRFYHYLDIGEPVVKIAKIKNIIEEGLEDGSASLIEYSDVINDEYYQSFSPNAIIKTADRLEKLLDVGDTVKYKNKRHIIRTLNINKNNYNVNGLWFKYGELKEIELHENRIVQEVRE